MRNLKRNLLCSFIFAAFALTGQSAQAWGTTGTPDTGNRFAAGDIFVSLSNGTVQWRKADGSLKQVLETGAGPAKNMAFDDAGNLYVPHWYNNESTAGNNVVKLDTTGKLVGDFGKGYNCDPTSIQFDVAGNVYVGQAAGAGTSITTASFNTFPGYKTGAHNANGCDFHLRQIVDEVRQGQFVVK